jgi:hypothetical protein
VPHPYGDLLHHSERKVMRALPRYFVAPLVLVAAALFVGAPTHFAAASVAHPGVHKVLPGDCPAGTNWDDILQACV